MSSVPIGENLILFITQELFQRGRGLYYGLNALSNKSEKELKSLNRKLENLNQYLGRTEPPEKA
nr:hypothetical protein [uncultured Blautia sp.]